MEFGFTWAALLNLDHFRLAISNKGSTGDPGPSLPPVHLHLQPMTPVRGLGQPHLSAKASLGNSATSSKVKG